jgi:flagellar FliL protein
MAENTTPDEAPAKKGKLKLIIMLVVIVILAIALSVAGTLWFLGGGLPGADSGEDDANAEPEFVASIYTDLEKALVTTVQAQGRQRYAQVYLSFEAKDPQALEAVEVHMPLIRSEVTKVLSSTGFSDLQSPEGRKDLAQQMSDRVNQVLEQEQEPTIERVLFRNFVVQ